MAVCRGEALKLDGPTSLPRQLVCQAWMDIAGTDLVAYQRAERGVGVLTDSSSDVDFQEIWQTNLYG